jgi:hypothetical protein
MGRVFTVVNLFKGRPLLLLSYPIFALYSFSLCKNPNLQSSTTVLAAAIDLLPLTLDHCHYMGKKKSSSKSKEVLVDEKASFLFIENQEFIAMRAAEKLWLVPTTTEDQLRDLVKDGLIQEKDFAYWKVPGQHRVPTPGPGEIILFISFVRAGLYLPASAFLHRFLQYFRICLNHLTPNVDETWSAVYQGVCPR